MHAEAYNAVGQMVAAASQQAGFKPFLKGLDVGGADYNGSARAHFGPDVEWSNLDLLDPTATYQRDARLKLWDDDRWVEDQPEFGLVLCTEVLEHVRWWPLVVSTCFEALWEGGFLFLTAAAPPRPPHSAQGLDTKPADEWYENVDPDELRALVDEVFAPQRVEHAWRQSPGDVYLWAQK